MWIVWVLGIIVFLIMEHTVAFWLVFVPLVLLGVVTTIKFFSPNHSKVSDLLFILLLFVVVIILLVVICM